MNRTKKIITIREAVEKIENSSTIGVSGFSYMNPPMAIIREIIRQKKRDLTLVSGPTSSIETDILIGAGCVKKVITSCVSFEKIIGIAPNFRDKIEKNEVELWECDESMWHLAIKSGTYNMPYAVYKGGIGSSIPELNKEIEMIKDHGQRYLKIPAIKIDTAIIHAGLADEYGNVQFPNELFLGRTYCEKELGMNAKTVIASVEKIVPNEFILRNPQNTILTNVFVTKARFGAHPGASNGYYMPDLAHYKEYVKAAEDSRVNKTKKFHDYLKRYVYDVKDHKEYLELIGISRLLELEHY
ncbi:CoA transferase subunit A [Candidatus Woesearchaeota archaeon]|nr:CoA transferase subunit A [Candidatus Woesearchaeota archaeon]